MSAVYTNALAFSHDSLLDGNGVNRLLPPGESVINRIRFPATISRSPVVPLPFALEVSACGEDWQFGWAG
jgi:hypothetical protein